MNLSKYSTFSCVKKTTTRNFLVAVLGYLPSCQSPQLKQKERGAYQMIVSFLSADSTF